MCGHRDVSPSKLQTFLPLWLSKMREMDGIPSCEREAKRGQLEKRTIQCDRFISFLSGKRRNSTRFPLISPTKKWQNVPVLVTGVEGNQTIVAKASGQICD